MLYKFFLLLTIAIISGCSAKTPVTASGPPLLLERDKGVYVAVERAVSEAGLVGAGSVVTRGIAKYSAKVMQCGEEENVPTALAHAADSGVEYVYVLDVKAWSSDNPARADVAVAVYDVAQGSLLRADRLDVSCGDGVSASACLRSRFEGWAASVYRSAW